MEKEISHKDGIILELARKIEEIKKEIGLRSEIKPTTARSLLIEVEGDKIRKKQSKRLEDLLGEGHSDNESISDHKRSSLKNTDGKEHKMMHRLGSKNLKKN